MTLKGRERRRSSPNLRQDYAPSSCLVGTRKSTQNLGQDSRNLNSELRSRKDNPQHLSHMNRFTFYFKARPFNCDRTLPAVKWNTVLNKLHAMSFIIPQYVLQQVRSLFQGEFSTQSDLLLPLSISSNSRFLKVVQQLITFSPSSSLHVIPSILPSIMCFIRQFLREM